MKYQIRKLLKSQNLLVIGGMVLLTAGVYSGAFAQYTSDGQLTTYPGLGVSGDTRIGEFTERMFSLIEGNLGAMIMVIAGLAAIVSAAFGAFRAAISLLVVALGAFILRSLVEIFFNYRPPV